MNSFYIARSLPVLAMLLLVACATKPEPRTVDAALAVTTSGYVDTDFDLSRIIGKEHSITLRFMLQYPNSDDNAFLAENRDGTLFIGKATSMPFGKDVPAIRIQYGDSNAVYQDVKVYDEWLTDGQESPSNIMRPVGLAAGRWYHLAVTVDKAGRITVYINGNRRSSRDPLPNNASMQPVGNGDRPSGKIRFGHRRDPRTPPDQFYGLLDDVGIWDRELSANEVERLAKKEKLTGTENSLLAGWNFDLHLGGAVAPPKHNGLLVYKGNARVVWPPVPGAWAELLPVPMHNSDLRFPLDEDSKIIQQADVNDGSHRGYASFCLDVVRANESQSARGLAVRAMDRGKVIFIRDTSPDDQPDQQVPGCTECPDKPGSCAYLANEVVIEHGPGDYTGYLHLIPGSVPDSVRAKLGTNQMVEKGEIIGRVGRSGTKGDHLHVGHLSVAALANGDNGSKACRYGDHTIGSLAQSGGAAVDQGTGIVRTHCKRDEPITTGAACGYKAAVEPFFPKTSPFRVHYLVKRNGVYVPEYKTPELGEEILPGPY